MVNDLVFWRDTLIICGGFLDHPDTSVFYFAEGAFHPYGHVGFAASRLRVIEDTLWVVGYSGIVDGQLSCGVAKRAGNQWVPVGNMPGVNNHLLDITKFQGELIVVGIGPRVNNRHGVYHLANGEWQLFNGGITGLVSRPSIMSIYQGVLFLGGQIREAEGNVGHGLISWNGSEYENVGGGLKWAPNDPYTLTGVTTLEVRDDFLFIGGGFLYAGDHPTQGLVTWDGTGWCDIQGDFMGTSGGYFVRDMVFSGDSLYIASTGEVDGVAGFFAAAAAVSDLPGACQDTGVPAAALSSATLWFDEYSQLHCLGFASGVYDLRVVDMLGKLVHQGKLAVYGNGIQSFRLPALTTGIYSVTVGQTSTRVRINH